MTTQPDEPIRAIVPVEIAFLARRLTSQKNFGKGVARYLTPCFHLLVMPNQPSPDKAMLAIRLPRPLKRRVEKKAKAHSMTVSDYVVWVLTKETQDIELSPNDYRKLAEEVEAARQGNRADHRVRSARRSGEN